MDIKNFECLNLEALYCSKPIPFTFSFLFHSQSYNEWHAQLSPLCSLRPPGPHWRREDKVRVSKEDCPSNSWSSHQQFRSRAIIRVQNSYSSINAIQSQAYTCHDCPLDMALEQVVSVSDLTLVGQKRLEQQMVCEAY